MPARQNYSTVQRKRRAPLSLRTTDELRIKLEVVANEAGRSLTQELEWRLEQSFLQPSRDEALIDALADRLEKRANDAAFVTRYPHGSLAPVQPRDEFIS